MFNLNFIILNLKNSVNFVTIIVIVVLSFSCQSTKPELVVSRLEYKDRLKGFWLGSCIGNWTGLPTENRRTDFPFFTDSDFGPGKFDYVLDQDPWELMMILILNMYINMQLKRIIITN